MDEACVVEIRPGDLIFRDDRQDYLFGWRQERRRGVATQGGEVSLINHAELLLYPARHATGDAPACDTRHTACGMQHAVWAKEEERERRADMGQT